MEGMTDQAAYAAADGQRHYCHDESKGGCKTPAAYRVHLRDSTGEFFYGSCDAHLNNFVHTTKWTYVAHTLIDY